MTYLQAKLAACDFTISDAAKLRDAGSTLLASLSASDEDIQDGIDLTMRADEMESN